MTEEVSNKPFSYRTFKIVLAIILISFLGLGACGVRACWNSIPASTSSSTQPTQAQPPAQQPVYRPPVQQQPVSKATPYVTPTGNTGLIKLKVDAWLAANSDRQGKGKISDIFPNEPYNATVSRFSEPLASKWADNVKYWSQVRIDHNRDGIDDEKWTLKNGVTYQRELLDPSGNVVKRELFR